MQQTLWCSGSCVFIGWVGTGWRTRNRSLLPLVQCFLPLCFLNPWLLTCLREGQCPLDVPGSPVRGVNPSNREGDWNKGYAVASLLSSPRHVSALPRFSCSSNSSRQCVLRTQNQHQQGLLPLLEQTSSAFCCVWEIWVQLKLQTARTQHNHMHMLAFFLNPLFGTSSSKAVQQSSSHIKVWFGKRHFSQELCK